jgi:hypothetical protein
MAWPCTVPWQAVLSTTAWSGPGLRVPLLFNFQQLVHIEYQYIYIEYMLFKKQFFFFLIFIIYEMVKTINQVYRVQLYPLVDLQYDGGTVQSTRPIRLDLSIQT